MKIITKSRNRCIRAMRALSMFLTVALVLSGCGPGSEPTTPQAKTPAIEATEVMEATAEVVLSDEQIENLVRRSYPFVAMYNVNNKFALTQGGWNTVDVNTELKDHTMQDIARPNNDSLYIGVMLDLTREPMILEIPAFDSKYVSLMITGYDHYVNIPMSTGVGDFDEPEKMLVYTARTQGYEGEKIEGIDRYFEATGDFVSAVFRVMPHANEPERFDRIAEQMKQVKLVSLAEYQGGKAKPVADIEFPDLGQRDADIFENNLLQVMQFMFNHTTFAPEDELDRQLLAAYEPLGVVPDREYDPDAVAKIDGKKFREAAEQVFKVEVANATDPEFIDKNLLNLFQPKGKIPLEALVFQSIIGPIGQPAEEAVYPSIVTVDGQPMSANHDYVIRMRADQLPPARAFWSLTLYDTKNGWFMPNDRKKYSVGENGGMQLDDDGGIDIYIAAEQPEGVPEENWLPLVRGDYEIDVILRLYNPDLEAFENWSPPQAARLTAP